VTQLIHLIATATPSPPSTANPAVPAMLDLIVARALQKQPADRYQSAAELASDLRACLNELTGAKEPQPATGMAAAPHESSSATVAQVDVPLDKTVASADAAAKVVAASTTVIEAGTHLPLARKFDSTAALRRLNEQAARSAAGDSAQAPAPRRGVLALLWRYPGRSLFAVGVLAASAAAYYVAYFY